MNTEEKFQKQGSEQYTGSRWNDSGIGYWIEELVWKLEDKQRKKYSCLRDNLLHFLYHFVSN